MKIVAVATLFCFSYLNAQTTSIKVTEVQRNDLSSPLTGQVTISCMTDYNPTRCIASASALAKVLQRYPTARLGDWKFVLAGTEHWQQIVTSLGGDPESPAFTELVARVTVLEDRLFETADSHKANLAQRYGQPLSGFSTTPSPTRWDTPSAKSAARSWRMPMASLCVWESTQYAGVGAKSNAPFKMPPPDFCLTVRRP